LVLVVIYSDSMESLAPTTWLWAHGLGGLLSDAEWNRGWVRSVGTTLSIGLAESTPGSPVGLSRSAPGNGWWARMGHAVGKEKKAYILVYLVNRKIQRNRRVN
jgi:hypothetical protein